MRSVSDIVLSLNRDASPADRPPTVRPFAAEAFIPTFFRTTKGALLRQTE